MTNKSLLKQLKKANIVVRKNVVLRAGEKSDFYVDVKKVYGNPKLLNEIGRAITKDINKETTCLATSGYGGIPLATVISQITGLPLSLVRGDEKNHGRGGLIDGYIPNEQDIVAVIDDVYTTGSSLRQTIKIISKMNATITRCHVVVARNNTDNFQIPVSLLFKSDDLIKFQ